MRTRSVRRLNGSCGSRESGRHATCYTVEHMQSVLIFLLDLMALSRQHNLFIYNTYHTCSTVYIKLKWNTFEIKKGSNKKTKKHIIEDTEEHQSSEYNPRNNHNRPRFHQSAITTLKTVGFSSSLVRWCKMMSESAQHSQNRHMCAKTTAAAVIRDLGKRP